GRNDFVYAMPGPVSTINPTGPGMSDLNVTSAWEPAYETLVDFYWPIHLADTKKILAKSGVTGLVKPLLASSWEVSSDAKTYRFHLRKGVKSQYGNVFSADDVVWSIQKVFAAAATGRFV